MNQAPRQCPSCHVLTPPAILEFHRRVTMLLSEAPGEFEGVFVHDHATGQWWDRVTPVIYTDHHQAEEAVDQAVKLANLDDLRLRPLLGELRAEGPLLAGAWTVSSV